MSPPTDDVDHRSEAAAGALFFLVGAVALLGIIVAEVLYPEYTTLQEISDLGASRPPNSVVHQPSSTIFNATMLVSGAFVLGGTYFVHRAFDRRWVTAITVVDLQSDAVTITPPLLVGTVVPPAVSVAFAAKFLLAIDGRTRDRIPEATEGAE